MLIIDQSVVIKLINNITFDNTIMNSFAKTESLTNYLKM